MPPVYFLDTSFLFALLNKADEHHPEAFEKQKIISNSRKRLITTEYVLVELANGLSAIKYREIAVKTINVLRNNKYIIIINSSKELFIRGLEYYEKYIDKEWSLTDCISFLVMKDYKVHSALTTDHHFTQAGFEIII